MKKTISFILAAMLLLVGCSTRESNNKWKPQHVSENIKPYAEKALNIVEQYLAFDISLEEFYADMSDVNNRLDWDDFLDWDDLEKTNIADLTVCNAISDLYYHYDEFTDNAFRMYRDILRFQLGQNVKDTIYSPAKNIRAYDDESQYIAKQLKLEDLPIFDASVYIFDDSSLPTVSLTFDLANGVTPEDAFTHSKTLIQQMKKHEICLDYLTIYYHIYGQTTFIVDVRLNDSGEYALDLSFIDDKNTEREYFEPTDENVEQMVIAATAYVSDYVK